MSRALALVVLLNAASARASVGAISIDELIRRSDLIVIATVRSVDVENRVRIATAEVNEVLAGAPGATVRFIAQPQMRCSVATAVPGEQVLLFLKTSSASEPAWIALYGRGRLPLRSIDGERFAVWPGKVWPETLGLWEALEPSDERVVALDELIARIRKVVKEMAEDREASSLRSLQHSPG